MSTSDDTTPAAETPSAPKPVAAPRTRMQRLRLPLMLGGVALAAVIALGFWLSGGRYEATNDAYVRVASVGVSTDIQGRVREVLVHENQHVKAGQILFTLKSEPAQVAMQQAAADLAAARQGIKETQASYAQRAAELRAAEATAAYRDRDLARDAGLMKAGAVSRAEYDESVHQAQVARQQVAVARQQLAAEAVRLGGGPRASIGANPDVRRASAAIARAQLQESYTVVRAPQDGVVTKVEQLQVGDTISATTPVFNLVTGKVWIEAAFKENQLNNMRPGQLARVKVDAYPGHVFEARIESIAPGTDQTFSLLPAENASGNWVKVVQRVPVRLVFS
ncbi:MAG: HlyD family secretion protein, partial [Caulobacteraceae bacterium]